MINGLAIDRIFENIFSSGIYFQDIYFTERLRTLAENIIIDILRQQLFQITKATAFCCEPKHDPAFRQS